MFRVVAYSKLCYRWSVVRNEMLDETSAALYKMHWRNGWRFSGHIERCGPQSCSHIASKGVVVTFVTAFAPKRILLLDKG
jgi:hypothetical protein